MTPLCDVAVIGCGPTGALLGNLLGARGLRVTILEKQPAPYDLPRAVHFDGEAMRIFQSAGLAEAILPHTHVNPGMLFKDPAGTVLVDWSRDPSPGPMGWPESFRCHQPGVEAILRAGLRRYPDVTLSQGVAVTGLAQDDTQVMLATTDGPLRARYAVACDGAASPSRAALRIGLEDLGFRERWLVVDLALTRPRPELGDHSIQYCDPEAPATYVRGVGDRRRWEIRLDKGDPDSVAEAQVWPRLARWIGPEDATLERAAIYIFRSRLARHWQRGRVFLAGDAAHQMPPFMGQGMCAGLRDAANIGWKLAAVMGGADPGLLDSYEPERSPNARAFIALSADLGRLINRTAAGRVPEGRMQSILPDLGPGIGKRDGVAGGLVPQVGRADDLARGGVYALTRAPVDLPVPHVVGAAGWLAERDLFGVLLRPDGYALAAAADAGVLVHEVRRYSGLIDALAPRDIGGLPEAAG